MVQSMTVIRSPKPWQYYSKLESSTVCVFHLSLKYFSLFYFLGECILVNTQISSSNGDKSDTWSDFNFEQRSVSTWR